MCVYGVCVCGMCVVCVCVCYVSVGGQCVSVCVCTGVGQDGERGLWTVGPHGYVNRK